METHLMESAVGDCVGATVLDLEGPGLRARQAVDAGATSVDAVDLSPEMDLVVTNRVFNHAGTTEELEGMWQNVVTYPRSGGRFAGIRACDPRRPAFANGRRDTAWHTRTSWRSPAAGASVQITHSAPVEFECASMEVSCAGSTAMHKKYGLCHVDIEHYENTEVFRSGPEFWRLFQEEPPVDVVKARKRGS
ncbi:hypothetical protein DL768_000757 [Monosporascus sp. mg162]|nr:hypothetical protein DL768_000757 [Monosporascus sp. mg162]